MLHLCNIEMLAFFNSDFVLEASETPMDCCLDRRPSKKKSSLMQDKFIAITCFQSCEPSVFQPPPQKALQHTLNLANTYHPAECNALAEDKCGLKGSPTVPKTLGSCFLKIQTIGEEGGEAGILLIGSQI